VLKSGAYGMADDELTKGKELKCSRRGALRGQSIHNPENDRYTTRGWKRREGEGLWGSVIRTIHRFLQKRTSRPFKRQRGKAKVRRLVGKGGRKKVWST